MVEGDLVLVVADGGLEGVARGEQTLDEVGFEQPETVAGLDVAEGEVEEERLVAGRRLLEGAGPDPLQRRLVVRKLLRRHQAQLLEQRAVGLEALEHLDDGRGDVLADVEQRLLDPRLLEDLAERLIAAELAHVERLVERRPEDQVLADRGLAVVVLGIEGLEQLGHASLLELLAEHDPRLNEALLDLGVEHREPPGQPEAHHILGEVRHRERDLELVEDVLGSVGACRLVVDPVGLDVELVAARLDDVVPARPRAAAALVWRMP